MSFPEEIKRIRQRSFLTQQDFAKKIGVAFSTVNRWESGRAKPNLGLIFLRYADILYKQHKEEIEAEYNRLKGESMEKSIKEISIEKCGFYLPECAYYDFINDAPDDANKATIVKKAMEAIEDEYPKMGGVLPKEVYAQLVPEEEPELLSNIVRIFKDIPENSTIDIFGEIYEYFLGNFGIKMNSHVPS